MGDGVEYKTNSMKTYKYTISFNAFKEFEIKADSPEEANELLKTKIEELITKAWESIDLHSPHGHVVPEECKDEFPYEY